MPFLPENRERPDRAVRGVDYEIRPGLPEDFELVGDSWRRSFSDTFEARAPQLSDYIGAQRQAVAQCLRTSAVAVAYSVEEPDEAMGWICYRPPSVVHYVYVKRDYRGRGIGRELWSHATSAANGRVWVTHRTPYLAWLSPLAKPRFCPVLIFDPKEGL
jgi:GNAT superfamily N-acetyltransferase